MLSIQTTGQESRSRALPITDLYPNAGTDLDPQRGIPEHMEYSFGQKTPPSITEQGMRPSKNPRASISEPQIALGGFSGVLIHSSSLLLGSEATAYSVAVTVMSLIDVKGCHFPPPTTFTPRCSQSTDFSTDQRQKRKCAHGRRSCELNNDSWIER